MVCIKAEKKLYCSESVSPLFGIPLCSSALNLCLLTIPMKVSSVWENSKFYFILCKNWSLLLQLGFQAHSAWNKSGLVFGGVVAAVLSQVISRWWTAPPRSIRLFRMQKSTWTRWKVATEAPTCSLSPSKSWLTWSKLNLVSSPSSCWTSVLFQMVTRTQISYEVQEISNSWISAHQFLKEFLFSEFSHLKKTSIV